MSDFTSEWLAPATDGIDEEFVAYRHGRTYRRRSVNPWLAPLVGGFGLAAAFAGQYLVVLPHAEDDLRNRISQRLTEAGMGNLRVIVNGRDVVLDGTLPALADVNRASSIVQNVEGVRAVQEVLVSFAQPTSASVAAPKPTRSATPTAILTGGFSTSGTR